MGFFRKTAKKRNKWRNSILGINKYDEVWSETSMKSLFADLENEKLYLSQQELNFQYLQESYDAYLKKENQDFEKRVEKQLKEQEQYLEESIERLLKKQEEEQGLLEGFINNFEKTSPQILSHFDFNKYSFCSEQYDEISSTYSLSELYYFFNKECSENISLYSLDYYYYEIIRKYAEIKKTKNLIKVLTKQIRFLFNLTKRRLRNLRQFFTIIHSFHFKNLDDYHSLGFNRSYRLGLG